MTALTDATFYAPLTSTGTPTNGSGTFTLTRATTKNIINVSGVLETVASGNLAINSSYGVHIDHESKTNNLLYGRDLTQDQIWHGSGYDAELVTNGTFNTDVTGWTVTATGVVTWDASGKLSLQLVTAGDTAYAPITCSIGQVYVVSVSVQSGVGSARFHIGTTAGGSQTKLVGQPTSGATQIFSAKFTATASTHYVSVTCTSVTTRLFDNISVKKLAITAAKTATGIDGIANACSLLTANAIDATVLQTIIAASAAGCSAFWVKRGSGTGIVEFTRDNVTWLDITGYLSTVAFYVAKIENTSVNNPVIGFRMGSAGDTIIVDAGLNHLGTLLCEPILTTATAVTRNAEPLTYQTSGNFGDTAGTILATFTPTYDTWPSGSVVGKASFGLLASASNSGVQAADGTVTVSGTAGISAGQRKIGVRWSDGFLQAFHESNYGVAGSYDGSFNLTTIAINSGAAGYVKDIAIFNTQLSNESVKRAWRPESLKVSALSNLRIKPVRENLTLLYANNWAGVTQAAPSELLASGAKRYQNAGTSVSTQAIIATGNPVTITTQAGLEYAGGDFVQMVSGANSMKGDITAYDNVTGVLTFYVQYSTGSGTYSSWNVGGTIPAGRNTVGNIKFVGADIQTGFPLPAGTPIFASASTTFGMYVIDWVDGFPTNDAAGLAASAATTYESVTINGVTTTALVIDQTQTVAPNCTRVGYKKQTWATLYRNVAAAADLPTLLIRQDLWINDLAGKFTATNKRVTIADFKTGSASQGGDFRCVVTLIYADSADAAAFIVPVGTIGWEIVIDNQANSTGPALGGETFVSIKIFNLSIPVPTEQFFKFDVYWKRAASYADVSSGRFLVRYKLQGAANYVTVLDVNAASIAAYNSANSTSWVNRHMGVRGNMWQRMFFLGLYGRYAYTNMKVKCANLEIWNGLID